MSVGRICSHHVDLADGEEIPHGAGEPAGILTGRDPVVRALAQGKDPREARVEEVMTRNLSTVSEATPIEHSLALMRAGEFRRRPVIGGDGTLTGLVTLDQILRSLAEPFSHVGALFENEMPAGTEVSRLRRRPAI